MGPNTYSQGIWKTRGIDFRWMWPKKNEFPRSFCRPNKVAVVYMDDGARILVPTSRGKVWLTWSFWESLILSMGFSGTPKNLMGPPYGKRDPYYSHTTPNPESLKIWVHGMGIILDFGAIIRHFRFLFFRFDFFSLTRELVK